VFSDFATQALSWFEAAAKENDVYVRLQAEDLEDVAAALAVFGDYSVATELAPQTKFALLQFVEELQKMAVDNGLLTPKMLPGESRFSRRTIYRGARGFRPALSLAGVALGGRRRSFGAVNLRLARESSINGSIPTARSTGSKSA
jgi:hypothetical protein